MEGVCYWMDTELYSDTRSYCWISQIMHTTICLLLLLLDRRKCHSRAVCAVVVPWWLAGLHCNSMHLFRVAGTHISMLALPKVHEFQFINSHSRQAAGMQ